MLYRKAIDYLIEWKSRSVRMPLVIRGARQVGKSCMVQMFAKEQFDNFIEINFEKDRLSRDDFAYINEDYLSNIPEKMADELPIISADPLNLYHKLEELILNKELRIEAGKKGVEFVKRWHNPEKIAKAVLKIYKVPSLKFADIYTP